MDWTVIEVTENVEAPVEMYELAWCGIFCSGKGKT